jgi:hypothetical protein
VGEHRGDGTADAVAGLVARDDEPDVLDLPERARQCERSLDGVRAVQSLVGEVVRLVGAHRQRATDGRLGTRRPSGQHDYVVAGVSVLLLEL